VFRAPAAVFPCPFVPIQFRTTPVGHRRPSFVFPEGIPVAPYRSPLCLISRLRENDAGHVINFDLPCQKRSNQCTRANADSVRGRLLSFRFHDVCSRVGSLRLFGINSSAMWFKIRKVFESAMRKESSFQFASGCDRSDQAKLSLGFEKESARASAMSLASTRKEDRRTRRHSATPMIVPFLLFSARQYGVAEL